MTRSPPDRRPDGGSRPAAMTVLLVAALATGCAAPPAPTPRVIPPAAVQAPLPAPPPPAPLPVPSEAELGAQRQQWAVSRLQSIGWPVSVSTARLCPRPVASIGSLPASLLDAPESQREVLRAVFGLDARATLPFVVDGAPAASADLRPGDLIETVEGADVGYGRDARARLHAALDRALAPSTPVRLGLSRGVQRIERAVVPRPACVRAVMPKTDDGDTPLRWESGTLWVGRELMSALDDRELALVLAHVMARGDRPRDRPTGPARRDPEFDRQVLGALEAAGLTVRDAARTWASIAQRLPVLVRQHDIPAEPARLRAIERVAAAPRTAASATRNRSDPTAPGGVGPREVRWVSTTYTPPDR